jgi:hypothetical protein
LQNTPTSERFSFHADCLVIEKRSRVFCNLSAFYTLQNTPTSERFSFHADCLVIEKRSSPAEKFCARPAMTAARAQRLIGQT